MRLWTLNPDKTPTGNTITVARGAPETRDRANYASRRPPVTDRVVCWDGSQWIEYDDLPEPFMRAARRARRLAAMTPEQLADKIEALTRLLVDTAPEDAPLDVLHEKWQPGMFVEIGDRVFHDGALFETIQAHRTQADWPPDSVPALFKVVHGSADGPAPWVQPTGAHDAYGQGDQVTHNGALWESTVDANVWEPPTQWTQV